MKDQPQQAKRQANATSKKQKLLKLKVQLPLEENFFPKVALSLDELQQYKKHSKSQLQQLIQVVDTANNNFNWTECQTKDGVHFSKTQFVARDEVHHTTCPSILLTSNVLVRAFAEEIMTAVAKKDTRESRRLLSYLFPDTFLDTSTLASFNALVGSTPPISARNSATPPIGPPNLQPLPKSQKSKQRGAPLYSATSSTKDAPKRYRAIKWCAFKTPTNKSNPRTRKRNDSAHGGSAQHQALDMCVLEYCGVKRATSSSDVIGFWFQDGIVREREVPELTHLGFSRVSKFRIGILLSKTQRSDVVLVSCVCQILNPQSDPCLNEALELVLQENVSCVCRLKGLIERQRLSSMRFLEQWQWIPNDQRRACAVCLRGFFWRRKHHCRTCGEVVCANCAPYRELEEPIFEITELRVCSTCLATLVAQRTKRLDANARHGTGTGGGNSRSSGTGTSGGRGSHANNQLFNMDDVSTESFVTALRSPEGRSSYEEFLEQMRESQRFSLRVPRSGGATGFGASAAGAGTGVVDAGGAEGGVSGSGGEQILLASQHGPGMFEDNRAFASHEPMASPPNMMALRATSSQLEFPPGSYGAFSSNDDFAFGGGSPPTSGTVQKSSESIKWHPSSPPKEMNGYERQVKTTMDTLHALMDRVHNVRNSIALTASELDVVEHDSPRRITLPKMTTAHLAATTPIRDASASVPAKAPKSCASMPSLPVSSSHALGDSKRMLSAADQALEFIQRTMEVCEPEQGEQLEAVIHSTFAAAEATQKAGEALINSFSMSMRNQQADSPRDINEPNEPEQTVSVATPTPAEGEEAYTPKSSSSSMDGSATNPFASTNYEKIMAKIEAEERQVAEAKMILEQQEQDQAESNMRMLMLPPAFSSAPPFQHSTTTTNNNNNNKNLGSSYVKNLRIAELEEQVRELTQNLQLAHERLSYFHGQNNLSLDGHDQPESEHSSQLNEAEDEEEEKKLSPDKLMKPFHFNQVAEWDRERRGVRLNRRRTCEVGETMRSPSLTPTQAKAQARATLAAQTREERELLTASFQESSTTRDHAQISTSCDPVLDSAGKKTSMKIIAIGDLTSGARRQLAPTRPSLVEEEKFHRSQLEQQQREEEKGEAEDETEDEQDTINEMQMRGLLTSLANNASVAEVQTMLSVHSQSRASSVHESDDDNDDEQQEMDQQYNRLMGPGRRATQQDQDMSPQRQLARKPFMMEPQSQSPPRGTRPPQSTPSPTRTNPGTIQKPRSMTTLYERAPQPTRYSEGRSRVLNQSHHQRRERQFQQFVFDQQLQQQQIQQRQQLQQRQSPTRQRGSPHNTTMPPRMPPPPPPSRRPPPPPPTLPPPPAVTGTGASSASTGRLKPKGSSLSKLSSYELECIVEIRRCLASLERECGDWDAQSRRMSSLVQIFRSLLTKRERSEYVTLPHQTIQYERVLEETPSVIQLLRLAGYLSLPGKLVMSRIDLDCLGLLVREMELLLRPKSTVG